MSIRMKLGNQFLNGLIVGEQLEKSGHYNKIFLILSSSYGSRGCFARVQHFFFGISLQQESITSG